MPLNDDERQQLQQILFAMEQGLTGSDAATMVDQVLSANAARMQAQAEAKTGLLGAISETGLTAAQQGLSENDLASVIASMQATAGLNTGEPFQQRIGDVLAPLYGREAGTPFDTEASVPGGFPTQSFVQQTQGMPGGLSPLADIGFDESDVAAINQQVRAMKAEGGTLDQISQAIYAQLTAGPPDPVTGQPTIDEAGQEYVGEFGGLIDQAVRNAYLASPTTTTGGAPPPIRTETPALAPTGPTGPTGPGPDPNGQFNAAGILATGTGIGAGAALAQGLRGAAAPYGGGGTGVLRSIAAGVPRAAPRLPSTSVPDPSLITDVVPSSGSAGFLGFLRRLGGSLTNFGGIYPDYLPSSMIEGGPLDEDLYGTRPA
jgi:hypothetical protein